MSELRRFHNSMRILLNLDRSDLVLHGVLDRDDAATWELFQRNPHLFFIRADDPTAKRLWHLIESRQPKRKA